MLIDGASVGMYFQLMHRYCLTNRCGILLLERQNATEVAPFANKTVISYITRYVIRIPLVSPKGCSKLGCHEQHQNAQLGVKRLNGVTTADLLRVCVRLVAHKGNFAATVWPRELSLLATVSQLLDLVSSVAQVHHRTSLMMALHNPHKGVN